METLQGKIAIVTGSGRGIGKAIITALAKKGCKVVVADLTPRPKKDNPNELEPDTAVLTDAVLTTAGYEALSVQCDVTKDADVKAMVAAAVEKWGRVDILINNAGVTRDAMMMSKDPAKQMDDARWDFVYETNGKSAYRCTRAVWNAMCTQGYGRVVTVSSIVGLYGNLGQANYAFTKAGVYGMTMTLAKEGARKGVTANCVAPGFTATEMVMAIDEKIRNEKILPQVAMGRLVDPQEIAHAVVFLCENGAVTGQNVEVSCGYMG
jgi:3-oxoacyl-[acyl-carrier protein] reductase